MTVTSWLPLPYGGGACGTLQRASRCGETRLTMAVQTTAHADTDALIMPEMPAD
ncbi:MAG: hypothetical protein ACLVK0_13805 [Parabacteroides merdae]